MSTPNNIPETTRNVIPLRRAFSAHQEGIPVVVGEVQK